MASELMPKTTGDVETPNSSCDVAQAKPGESKVKVLNGVTVESLRRGWHHGIPKGKGRERHAKRCVEH